MGYEGPPFPHIVERLEKELTNQGCQIVDRDPDLLIEACGIYTKAQEFYRRCSNKPLRLYNLLDVNNSSLAFYNQAQLDYQECEIACTISNTVKTQIKQKFKTDREIHVIGFPMRPVTYRKYPRKLPFLYVGRWSDLNKRTYLIKPTLKLLNQDPVDDLVVIGSDKPPYECFYQGIVTDEVLDTFYNACEFLLLPSRTEGLGITAIEAVSTGAIPILCQDNVVIKELGLEDFAVLSSPENLSKLVKNIQKNIQYYWDKMDELRPKYQKQFSVETVTKNMLDLYYDYKRGKK